MKPHCSSPSSSTKPTATSNGSILRALLFAGLVCLISLLPMACRSSGGSSGGGSSDPGPVADAGISLSETPCFGTCPEYTLTLYPNEFYQLDSGRFTKNPGDSTGTLPAGSFAAANDALRAAGFASLPTDITPNNPTACGSTVASDLPRAIVSETTIAGARSVEYYPGCFDAPNKATLDTLVAALRTAMDVDGLVVP